MTAKPARQRKILADYKHPDPEGRAQAKYYRDASRLIRTFHARQHAPEWLIEHADRLGTQASTAPDRIRARLDHNARALVAYAEHFGVSRGTLVSPPRVRLRYDNVVIGVVPDLAFSDKGGLRIVKIEFPVQPADELVLRIMSQVMFEALRQSDATASASSIAIYDLARGSITKGARLGARLGRDIEAACATIADIWPSI